MATVINVTMYFVFFWNGKDWVKAEVPKLRCCLIHALGLAKRTSNAKSPQILFLKQFIYKLLAETGRGVGSKNQTLNLNIINKPMLRLKTKNIYIYMMKY